ncbi:hypothetical protein NKG94_46480 [Micromonospora sp. M12]
MVVAKHAAAACKGVFLESTRLIMLTQIVQVDGEVVRGTQGVRMVVAEQTAVAGESVLVESARLIMLTQFG